MIATKLAAGQNRLVYRLTSTAAGSFVTLDNARLRADFPNNGGALARLIHGQRADLVAEFFKKAQVVTQLENLDSAWLAVTVGLDGSSRLEFSAGQVSGHGPTSWIVYILAENSLNQ